jgi:hypothetical protein
VKKYFSAIVMSLMFTAPSFATVKVSMPENGDTVGSPAHFVATAATTNCSRGVASMGVYIDNVLQYVATGNSLNSTVAVAPGPHRAVVEEWDKCGGASFTPVAINVTEQTGVFVTSPVNNSTVSAAVTFAATASTGTCPQGVASMGVYVNNKLLQVQKGAKFTTQMTLAAGPQHTVIEEWDYCGGASYATANLNVVVTGPVIPSNAITVSYLQMSPKWNGVDDQATLGNATGNMNIVGSPSQSGNALQFVTTFINSGGERYKLTFGSDTSATNFLYDAYVTLDSTSANIGNLEMDMNQVMPNGQTAIFGFQCDGYSGTWDYTTNAGTPQDPVDQWLHSKMPCNVRNWATNTSHHVQVSYSRDDSGMVTYHSVWLDGVEQDLNVTVPSAFTLGWSPTLLTNFQVDGLGASGSSTVYLDSLAISRW